MRALERKVPGPNSSRPAPRATAAASASTVPAGELTAFVVSALAIAVIRIWLVRGPQFFNDSYQYLSIADNLRRGHAIATSIIHFDTERAHGQLPAPETTLAPGYPILIWAASGTRLPPECVGLLISLASAIVVLPLIRSAAQSLALGRNATRLALLLWTLSAQGSLYGITLYAESIFTATTLAALALLLRNERDDERAPWRVPIALLLLGAGYCLRYAGLFFVAAVHAHALVRIARKRRHIGLWVSSLIACDALVALVMARNAVIAGTWKGGNSRPLYNGAAYVVHRLGVAAYELVLGSLQPPSSFPFGPFALLACAGGTAAVLTAARSYRGGRARLSSEHTQLAVLGSWVVIYCAGMAYLGLTTQISLGSRMFVPLLPGLALLALSMLEHSGTHPPSRSPARSGAGWVLMFVVGYVGANLSSTLQRPRIAEHRVVAQALELPMPSEEPLSQWMESSIPKDAVLLAVEGQATGYVLQRNTISAVGRDFTAVTWDETETRETMSRFGAEYLVVYPEVVATGGVDGLDSELFRRLASRAPPRWLELAAENPRVLVFRVRTVR